MEIEKKFLVREIPKDLDKYEKKEIEQGYLCSNPVVRIRKSNDRYILTYKSLGDDGFGTDGDVRINDEIEAPLSREGYEHLKKKIDGNMIEKSRYVIPLSDGHTGELDIFGGRLEGLFFIEVEFRDETDAKNFSPPEWFGKNVSGDERFSNSYLSRCDSLDVFARNE